MKTATMNTNSTEPKLKSDGVSPISEVHVEKASDEVLVDGFSAGHPVAITIAKARNKVKPKSKPIRKRRANAGQNDERRLG